MRRVSSKQCDQAYRDDHSDDTVRQRRERHEREQELRRIHVALLILEDRVVESRVRRVAVEHGLGRRQVREADVPGEEARAPRSARRRRP